MTVPRHAVERPPILFSNVLSHSPNFQAVVTTSRLDFAPRHAVAGSWESAVIAVESGTPEARALTFRWMARAARRISLVSERN